MTFTFGLGRWPPRIWRRRSSRRWQRDDAFPTGVRVWVAAGHTDMRRGMRGLALQVQEALKRDPHICVGCGYVAACSRSA
ncbi:MAG: IS66 family insertion sequence element accessory protein TnpB [Rhodoplanes sp.]